MAVNVKRFIYQISLHTFQHQILFTTPPLTTAPDYYSDILGHIYAELRQMLH